MSTDARRVQVGQHGASDTARMQHGRSARGGGQLRGGQLEVREHGEQPDDARRVARRVAQGSVVEELRSAAGDTRRGGLGGELLPTTSKRARQLIAGDLPLVDVKEGEKPLSIAIEELNKGELKIKAESAAEEE